MTFDLNLVLDLKLVSLLVAANGAPIIARNLFGTRLSTPVDLGARLWDGEPLFGPSKTYRGLAAAVVAGAAIGAVLGLNPGFGALFGLSSMAGDLFSSFVKRRAHVPGSDSVPVLDQVVEAAIPLVVLWPLLAISVVDSIFIVSAFFVADVLLSRLSYALHIRKHPM